MRLLTVTVPSIFVAAFLLTAPASRAQEAISPEKVQMLYQQAETINQLNSDFNSMIKNDSKVYLYNAYDSVLKDDVKLYFFMLEGIPHLMLTSELEGSEFQHYTVKVDQNSITWVHSDETYMTLKDSETSIYAAPFAGFSSYTELDNDTKFQTNYGLN